MPLPGDVPADIVQQAAVFDELAGVAAEPVNRLKLVEQFQIKPRHLLAMRLVPCSASQVENAAAARIRDLPGIDRSGRCRVR